MTPPLDAQSMEAIFRGELLTFSVRPASKKLGEWARNVVLEEFSSLPEGLDAEDFRRSLGRARHRIASPNGLSLAVDLLSALGLSAKGLLVDAPRLRAVPPGLESVPEAAPVYYAHRDTWYGNPRCQINGWIPLQAVDGRNSFRFYLEHFQREIDNDSHEFRATEFERQGGFGRTDQTIPSVYPRARISPGGPAKDVALRADETLLFSAAHLHQTLPNRTPKVRFSVDFRFFRAGDLESGRGAPDPDNRSQGLLTEGYHRCE